MAKKSTTRLLDGRKGGEVAQPRHGQRPVVSAPPAGLSPDSLRIWFGIGLIVAATTVAYLNSISTPFVFDDVPGILENPTIRSLWPLWGPLAPPPGGSSVVGRPMVNLSLALNYAFGGTDPRGYHIFNLLVHIGAGLALFGVVRRTLCLAWAPDWLRSSAVFAGLGTALLWGVHPLQTESVTCIIQRTESLGGLIYLTALYCFIRGTGSSVPQATNRWLMLSTIGCFVGVATKEIMVTLPVVMLLYDRAFIAGTFAAAWRQRRRFYIVSVLSWLLLAFLMEQSAHRGGTVTLGRGISAWTSLLTQADAVTMYLKLALWPYPLVVDYGDYIADVKLRLSDVLPSAIFLVLLLAATIYALIKRPAWGFVGAWFFLILGPSSSFIPLLSQARAEHRMYLPLAALVVLAVIGLTRVLGRTAPVGWGALALVLGLVTYTRNHDYRSGVATWTDTVQKRPQNPRAHYNLGIELDRSGDKQGAIRAYEEAIRLRSSYADPHMNLAALFLADGLIPAARDHAEAAYRLNPLSSNANNNMGQLRFFEGDLPEATRFFEEALRLSPDNAEGHNNLGYVLMIKGAITEAITHFRRAVQLRPDFMLAHHNLGKALLGEGRNAEAQSSLEQAVRLEPGFAEARSYLGHAFVANGLYEAAVPQFRAAARITPTDFRAQFNYGKALQLTGRNVEATECFQQVLRLDPENVAAQEMLEIMRGDPGPVNKNGP